MEQGQAQVPRAERVRRAGAAESPLVLGPEHDPLAGEGEGPRQGLRQVRLHC